MSASVRESCLAQWHLQGLSGVWWHCGRHLWMYSSSPFRGSTLPERWEITLDHRCADCNCSNMTGMNLLGDSTRLETFDCNIYVIPSHSFFQTSMNVKMQCQCVVNTQIVLTSLGVTCVHAGVDLIPPIKTVLWAATTHVRVSVLIFFIYIYLMNLSVQSCFVFTLSILLLAIAVPAWGVISPNKLFIFIFLPS